MNFKSSYKILSTWIFFIFSSITSRAEFSCLQLFIQDQSLPLQNEVAAAWTPPKSFAYDARITSDQLIKENFSINDNGSLVDLNTNTVLGQLLLFDVKSIYRWSNDPGLSKMISEGEVNGLTMKQILTNGEKEINGLMMGPGLYFSSHPTDTSEYGRKLLSFDLQRPILVLFIPLGSSKKWPPGTVFRLAELGIDAVTVAHYHTGIWFSFISHSILNNGNPL